jgi:hypothetical protein
MRPAINTKRSVAGVVPVQSACNVYIRRAKLHRPQFGIKLNGIYQKGIDSVCPYNFGQRFQYRLRLVQYPQVL